MYYRTALKKMCIYFYFTLFLLYFYDIDTFFNAIKQVQNGQN